MSHKKKRSSVRPTYTRIVRGACLSFLRLIGKPIYYILTIVVLVAPFLFFFVALPAGYSIIVDFIQKTSFVLLITLRTRLFIISIGLTFFLALGSTWTYLYVFKDLPSPRELLTRKQILTTKIYDRNGELLYKIYKDENRTLVPLSAIPDSLKYATISIEDRDFYRHNGFSVTSILRATRANFEHKRIQGGSTITQQLVKNTLLTPEKTLRRKMRELILAILVEASLSKDEILEMYFNEVSFGGSVYGVEEASRRYFDKSVRELSLAESAYLAGLPQAPSTYSPFGPTPELGFQRQHQVLQRMVDDKYITEEQAVKAREEKVVFQPDLNNIKAPHFVMFIRDLLAKEYGEEVLAQGGLDVVTTLDYSVQKFAQAAIDKELQRLAQLHVTNAASMVTNPQTGEILSMIGSRDYFDVEHDGQVNVTIRPRQPGSSIKPLTYSVAFQKGMSPATIVEDSPVTYGVVGSPPYSPKNYDDQYHGKVTIRTALANSYNIPAVKTLASVGVSSVIEQGRAMGITTWGEDQARRFGLSLTLGGGEVTMYDMAALYGTFANEGTTVLLNPILSIKNYKGDTLYKNPCLLEKVPCKGTRTLDPRIAYQITNILSDTVARAPAFGLNSVLTIPKQQVAVKTGTTNSLRDNWTFGYTTDRLVASWVGNNDNTPMSAVASGVTGASPIWNTIMRGLLDDMSPHAFASPSGLLKLRICSLTGTLPCKACPQQRDEYFIRGTEPKQACTNEGFLGSSPQPSPTIRSTILEGITTQ
ncbi:MAG TPA: PBP1A family penicillin-binding protein [Patescibacteria group bacterium]|nr:PBP1A family penicillin-binding protein [Patescibacteria group bacterium]